MVEKIIHYSDLHLKLYKQHSRDRKVLELALEKWKKAQPLVESGEWSLIEHA